jgi:hypothetical protein
MMGRFLPEWAPELRRLFTLSIRCTLTGVEVQRMKRARWAYIFRKRASEGDGFPLTARGYTISAVRTAAASKAGSLPHTLSSDQR